MEPAAPPYPPIVIAEPLEPPLPWRTRVNQMAARLQTACLNLVYPPRLHGLPHSRDCAWHTVFRVLDADAIY